jgi:WD40 repeat protein
VCCGFAIEMRSPDGGKLLHPWAGHWHDLSTLAFSPDGKVLATGGHDPMIHLWEPASGKPLRRLEVEELPGGARSLAFSPDGKVLASGGDSEKIVLWDVVRGKRVRSLRGQQGAAHSLAFSPDGKLLVAGDRNYTVRRWDVASGREVQPFQGQQPPKRGLGVGDKPLRFVAFSPDGRTLLAAADHDLRDEFDPRMLHQRADDSGNQLICLWEAATGRARMQLGGRRGQVSAFALSPDGTALVWDVPRLRAAGPPR